MPMSDSYNRMFYVKFDTSSYNREYAYVRSFYADVYSSIEVDVYVAYGRDFALYGQPVRDDSRWLCRKKINLNGVFNCPRTMAGTYLLFWPSPD